MITAPKNLKRTGKKFWVKMLTDYEITDSAGLQYLLRACESLDLIDECQKRIEKEGFTTIGSRGIVKQHPLLATLRDANSAFLQSMKALNLDLEPLKEGRGRPGGGNF